MKRQADNSLTDPQTGRTLHSARWRVWFSLNDSILDCRCSRLCLWTEWQNDLAAMRVFDRRRILNRIDEELSHQPTQETRHKKIISGLTFPWDHEEPAWELRVGEYRVFYDVDVMAQQVTVRAVRQKRTDDDGVKSLDRHDVELLLGHAAYTACRLPVDQDRIAHILCAH